MSFWNDLAEAFTSLLDKRAEKKEPTVQPAEVPEPKPEVPETVNHFNNNVKTESWSIEHGKVSSSLTDEGLKHLETLDTVEKAKGYLEAIQNHDTDIIAFANADPAVRLKNHLAYKAYTQAITSRIFRLYDENYVAVIAFLSGEGHGQDTILGPVSRGKNRYEILRDNS